MYTNREYTIFNVSELPSVDFTQVLETSTETLRLSVDKTKTFVKWNGEMPSSISGLTTREGSYTHEEILTILSTSEWSQPMILPIFTANVTITGNSFIPVSGTSTTYTANPINGGDNPTYEWFVNGISVGVELTYTFIPVNGDTIYVTMTSNLVDVVGVPAISTIITIMVGFHPMPPII